MHVACAAGDKTVDRLFLYKTRVHEMLHALLGAQWHPSLHSAVTFTSLPYDEAKAGFEWQDALLVRAGCALGALTLGAATSALLRGLATSRA